MTRKRSYLSKVLSACMAVIMCLSVFVLDWSNLAPKADAISQGSWSFRLWLNVNNTDKNANGPNFNVNGYGSFSDSATNGGERATRSWTSTTWPSSISCTASTSNGPDIEFYWYLQVYNNNNGSWVNIATGHWVDTSGGTGSSDYNTGNVGISGAPYIASRYISLSETSVTANNYGGATQSLTATAYCKDQYGVNRPADVSWSIPTNYNGLSLSSTSGDSITVYVPAAAGQGNHDNTIRGNVGDTNCDATLTVNNNYYYIDLNGTLDGTSFGNISGYGKANVVVNGSTVGSSVTDYYTAWPSGSTYSISNAGADAGRTYEGGAVSNQRLVGSNVAVNLDYRTNSTLTIAPNSGSWNGSTANQSYTRYWNQTLSVPNPTKDGWVFDNWAATGSTIGSLSGTTFTFNTKTTGQSETLTAKWHRGITNTYHWLEADAATDQSTTVSGTAYDTATTLALTAPTNTVTTVAKNDKTWTFMGWNETGSVTWGGATQTASVGNGASHNVATTSSAHTFYPVYALDTTKFYANYNILKDGEDTYTKVQKSVTVNGDATTGAMPVPTGSDNGSGADVAKYYSKGAYIYELKGWAPTNYTLGEGTATIPYTTAAATTTLNVPGAGTPTSTANTTPIELYPVYDLYATAIHTHFNYYDASANSTFLDVSGMALEGQDAGTVTFPGDDQVNTSYTKDGVTYTLVGWNLANDTNAYTAFGGTAQHAVLADPANDYYTYYPIYTCTTISRYYYYAADGAQTSTTKSTTLYKYDTFTPTTADVAIATASDVNNTITLDGRTFAFAGWRKDTTSADKTIDATGVENHAITDTEYKYYAVYQNDDLALSYNTTHDGITAVPTPVTQKQTQYINAGLVSSTDNASQLTFTVGPDGLVPVKKGYTFLGWSYTDSEAESADIANGNEITLQFNTTLYARFKVNVQNVSFVYYDGSDLEGGYATVTKTVSYDDGNRDDTATNARYVVTAPTVKKILSDNIVSSDIIVHANDKYHYIFKEWVRPDGKGVYNANTSGANYTASFKNVTDDISIQATYDAYAHHYVDLTTAELNALGIEGTASKDATCTTDGYQYKQCADCGHIYKEILAKLNHKDENGNDVKKYSGYKAPGCETTGKYATAACALCGDTVKVDGNVQYYDIVDNAFVAIVSADGIIPATGHDYEFKETVAPTCTERGYDLYVCKNNELHTKKENYTNAAGHTNVTIPEVPATCTTDGKTEKIYCSVCNCIVVDSYIVPALGHTLVKTAAKAASCTETGNIEYYTCSVCNKIYSDKYAVHEITTEDTVIAALGHDYVETPAEAATCTKDGHTAGSVCSRCGEPAEDSTAVETEAALGHDWDDGVYTASEKPCLTPGYTTYSCSRCDYTEVVYDELAAHTEKQVEAVPATCTTMGKTAYTVCEVCDEIITNFKWIPVKAHEYTITVSEEIPATCTEAGVSAKLACECGATIGGEEIPDLGHSFTGWVVVKAATCTENGSKERYCKVCGETETEIITAEGHKAVDVAELPATCTTEGCTAGTKCSVCGEKLSGCEVIAMLEHTMGEPEIIREATCALEGLKVTKCAYCEYQTVEPIAKIAHTEKTTKEAVAATCEASGKTAEIICEACGEVLQAQKTIAKLEHSYITVEAVAPTCTENGLSSYQKCKLCGFELTSPCEIPAAGHSFGEWQLVKAPTCTENGARERVCTVEGCTEKETKVLEALGHNVTKTEAKANACGKAGNIEYYTCSRCEGKFFEDEACTVEIAQADTVLAALEHSWGSPDVVFPNCTEKGYTLETCDYCGLTRKVDETDPLGHVGGVATCVDKAVCEVCGVAYGGFAAHDYVTENNPGTCTTSGSKTDTCTVCGKTVTVPTGFGDHSFTDENKVVVTPATCTTEGTYIVKCAYCDETRNGVIRPAGHADNNGDGVCDECSLDLTGGAGEGEGSGSGSSSGTCDKCGKDHGGKQGGLFGYNGFICKLLAFLHKIISFFKG